MKCMDEFLVLSCLNQCQSEISGWVYGILMSSSGRGRYMDSSMVFSCLKQWQSEISGWAFGIHVSKAVTE